MAPHRHDALYFLVLLTAHLVSCGDALRQALDCKEKVWAPNFLNNVGRPLPPAHMLFFGFPTQQECQAAMCAPRCSKYSLPTQPSSPQPSDERRIIRPAPPKRSDPPKDEVATDLPRIPDSGIKEIEEMKAILGPNSQVIFDEAGEVIGVEAAAGPAEKDTSSLPRPQGGNRHIPGDDASICCSTREAIYMNRTLIDYYGRTQVIAQRPQVGVYQPIRHGFCGSKGACVGECDQIYVNVFLVVHPTPAGQQVSFSLFKIPGYCTCRVRSLRNYWG